MKLYIGNLASHTTDQELEQLFAQVGSVEAVATFTDCHSGRPRGFAFVEMATREAGQAAIAQFNRQKVHGRRLTVKEADPREGRESYAQSRATNWYCEEDFFS